MTNAMRYDADELLRRADKYANWIALFIFLQFIVFLFGISHQDLDARPTIIPFVWGLVLIAATLSLVKFTFVEFDHIKSATEDREQKKKMMVIPWWRMMIVFGIVTVQIYLKIRGPF